MNLERNTEPLLKVRNITKHFGGVSALKGVDLDVYPGEVHGLVGANGAGKSTLIRILAGLFPPDAGVINLNGTPVTIKDPQHASDLGLSFIHQELNLIPKFSVLQNMVLGLPKATRFGLIDWSTVRQDVKQAADRVGISFSLDTVVSDLTVAEQWLVSIGRSLVRKARMIAMDEPTASLSEDESQRLFQIIKELQADGISILYVSHRLDEILSLCDGVSVFKDGNLVLKTDRKAISKYELVRAIVGEDIVEVNAVHPLKINKPIVLEACNLKRGKLVRGVSFKLHEGEVLGLGGLVGAGRTETARLLFGADKLESGEILFEGKPWVPNDPADAVSKGIGFVPEERRSQGLVLDKSVGFNINLPSLSFLRYLPGVPLINPGKEKRSSRKIVDLLRVKTESIDTRVGDLSGGNQQKVVIGKWLMRDLKILILDEPSRGVDVGARAEIHKIIHDLVGKGISVIVISSEIEEFVGLCDRVLVMVEGRVVGELIGPNITKEAILQLSYQHGQSVEKEVVCDE